MTGTFAEKIIKAHLVEGYHTAAMAMQLIKGPEAFDVRALLFYIKITIFLRHID